MQHKEAMVLLSGVSNNDPLIKVVCGMLLPRNDGELVTTSIFQLLPSNHSFSADLTCEKSEAAHVLKRQTTIWNTIEVVLQGENSEKAGLTLDESEGIGTLSWTWGGGLQGEQILQVELIEYIAFG